MENAINMTQQLVGSGYALVVAVLNAAIACNVPVEELLRAVSK